MTIDIVSGDEAEGHSCLSKYVLSLSGSSGVSDGSEIPFAIGATIALLSAFVRFDLDDEGV